MGEDCVVNADSISLELPRALSDSMAVSYPNRIDDISGSASADGLLQKLFKWSTYDGVSSALRPLNKAHSPMPVTSGVSVSLTRRMKVSFTFILLREVIAICLKRSVYGSKSAVSIVRYLSREFGELVEIWVAFFKEGILALLSFRHEVIKQGGVACKFHQARLAVKFGV